MGRPPLFVIAGPTGAGKSALALELARRIGGTIVNADASQLYADLRVLTARPTADDMARAPHRLYGVIDGAEAASAATWAARAADLLATLERPILVGGTGLYLRTLLDGIAPVPAIAPAVRAGVRALSAAAAAAALAVEDTAAAARLDPADQQRVRRALEVVRATGRPLHHWHAARAGGVGAMFTISGFVVDPGRDRLAGRLAARLDLMLAGGAPEEVAALVARRLSPALPVMKAVGVAPIAAWLGGAIDREAARARILLDTLHLAKRQRTWFRNQTPNWAQLDPNSNNIAQILLD